MFIQCQECGKQKAVFNARCEHCGMPDGRLELPYHLTDIERKRARAYGVWLARHDDQLVLADFTDDQTMEVVRNAR